MEIKNVENTSDDFKKLCKNLNDVYNEVVAEQRCKGASCCVGNEVYTNIYIMYDDDNPIACIAFKYCKDNTVEIGRVYVCERYRNYGIATKLFEIVEEIAKEQGAKTLILDTYERLTNAMKLYRKLGFKIVPQFSELKDSPFSICMSKKI